MSRYFLGIDIGGTASRWAIIDQAGGEVARGSAAGATGHLFTPTERERFTRAIAGIAASLGNQPVQAVHLGCTGLGEGVAADAHAIIAEAIGIAPASVTSSDDMALAYLAAFAPGGGHLISAGTGSIGLHIAADGERIRVGGRGILIDDGGSGSWVALKALDLIYREIDRLGHPGDAAILARHLYAAVGGERWDDVRAFVYGSDRGRIGTLAQAVGAAAADGDNVARGLIEGAVAELARLAEALIARAGEKPIAFVGGVLDIHAAIRPGLEQALAGHTVGFPKIDAALHAARIARKHTMEA